MNEIYQNSRSIFDYIRNLRRDFHEHPELGFKEVRTAKIVAEELEKYGFRVTKGVARTGVVGVLEGGEPGPTVMARFDMDALPVIENTGASYASKNPGVMHACGHDGHVAIGLGVARLLSCARTHLKGMIKLVFQPAEEGDGGAELMIAEGVLENQKPDYTLGIHVWNEMPLGHVLVVPGPFMAGADIFSVRITGRGGHGAVPHLATDPIVAASYVINGLQTILSRNVPPLETAVVSVTMIHAGDAFNVIPHTAEFRGTIRSFEPQVQKLVTKRFRELVEGICHSMGCEAEIEIEKTTPPVINDNNLATKIQAIVPLAVPGATLVTDFRTMGSEDFAFFMEQVPGCYLMVGSANPEKGLTYGHHHPQFDFDEEALINGVSLMTNAIFAMGID